MSDEHVHTDLFSKLPSLQVPALILRRAIHESQRVSYLLLRRLFLAPELYALNLEMENLEALCVLFNVCKGKESTTVNDASWWTYEEAY